MLNELTHERMLNNIAEADAQIEDVQSEYAGSDRPTWRMIYALTESAHSTLEAIRLIIEQEGKL